MNSAVFPILVPAFVEYEQRISSIDFWDPVCAYAARTRFSNQRIRDPVSICRGRLYTVCIKIISYNFLDLVHKVLVRTGNISNMRHSDFFLQIDTTSIAEDKKVFAQ